MEIIWCPFHIPPPRAGEQSLYLRKLSAVFVMAEGYLAEWDNPRIRRDVIIACADWAGVPAALLAAIVYNEGWCVGVYSQSRGGGYDGAAKAAKRAHAKNSTVFGCGQMTASTFQHALLKRGCDWQHADHVVPLVGALGCAFLLARLARLEGRSPQAIGARYGGSAAAGKRIAARFNARAEEGWSAVWPATLARKPPRKADAEALARELAGVRGGLNATS